MTQGEPHPAEPSESRAIQRSFSVAVPVDRAWRAMTDPDEISRWFFPFNPLASGEGEFDMFGEAASIDVLEVDPLRRLRYAEKGGPVRTVAGRAEVTVTFEDQGSGTRISITRSGFGDGEDWDAALESTGRGLEESIADLVLYLETGVAFPRHPRQPCPPGLVAREALGGLRVETVEPAGFADHLDLQPGDVLVELGGAAVFGHRELWFFMRQHQPGDEAEAAWVRDGQLVRGRARLGGRVGAA
jgi:uncharacterized protein YndB with AHSA1/START domain